MMHTPVALPPLCIPHSILVNSNPVQHLHASMHAYKMSGASMGKSAGSCLRCCWWWLSFDLDWFYCNTGIAILGTGTRVLLECMHVHVMCTYTCTLEYYQYNIAIHVYRYWYRDTGRDGTYCNIAIHDMTC